MSTLVTPAGWAFSIWGALYLGALVFAVFQALPQQHDSALMARVRRPVAVAFLANAGWATYVQLDDVTMVSVLIILVGLGSGLLAMRRLTNTPQPLSKRERWCAALPLTALAAWLTSATIVNISSALRYHGVEASASTAPIISAAVLVVGGLVAGTALARSKGCPPYAIVFLWALAAIFAKGGQLSSSVAIACAVAASIVIAGALIGWRRGGAHWTT
ncbi:hypothetical protein [Sphingopyxis sp.]|uniref:hypothetical protein n=1 Tax=Sphingopyxis sp. TaxID=1908224 RepID=UPI003D0B7847